MKMQAVHEGMMEHPQWLSRVLSVLVFLFPPLVATTDGGGSYIGAILLLLSFVYGRGWRSLAKDEKRIMLWFSAGLLAMILSMVNTQHAHLYEGFKYLARYLRLALIVPIYLMVRRFGFRFGKEFAFGAVAATVVMALQAWYQVGWEHEPLASGYYHKIVFGDLAVFWGAVAVVFALIMMRGWQRGMVVAVATMASLYASVLSVTRGSWLFVLLFLIVLAVISIRKVRFNRRSLAAMAMGVVVVCGIVSWQWGRLDGGVMLGVDDLKTFMTDPGAPTSWGIRLNLWRNTLLLAKEHPLLGVGLGDFHAEMRRMAADGESWSKAVADYGHAHSIYFDPLANGGLIALAATFTGYLLLPFLMFRRLLVEAESAEGRFYALGGVLTVMAFATFGLSEALWHRNPFVNSYVVSIIVFLSGAIAVRRRGGSVAREVGTQEGSIS